MTTGACNPGSPGLALLTVNLHATPCRRRLNRTADALIKDNHGATRPGNPVRMREVAERFDHTIRALPEARRDDAASTDVAGELLRDSVNGRPPNTEGLVSILRD